MRALALRLSLSAVLILGTAVSAAITGWKW